MGVLDCASPLSSLPSAVPSTCVRVCVSVCVCVGIDECVRVRMKARCNNVTRVEEVHAVR